MNKNKENLFVVIGGTSFLIAIVGLLFLFFRVIAIPIFCAILLPLIATFLAFKKSWLPQNILPAYSYIIIGLCVTSSFVLMMGHERYSDFVGPIVLDNYKQIWYESENYETGQPMEARGYTYDDPDGNMKASFMENFLWILIIGSPILTYVQTKKRYNVLTNSATH